MIRHFFFISYPIYMPSTNLYYDMGVSGWYGVRYEKCRMKIYLYYHTILPCQLMAICFRYMNVYPENTRLKIYTRQSVKTQQQQQQNCLVYVCFIFFHINPTEHNRFFANRVDSDETAPNELYHQDLQCLPFCSLFMTGTPMWNNGCVQIRC